MVSFVENFRVSEFFKHNTENDLLPAFNKFLSAQISNNQIDGTQLQDLVCAICQESITNFQDLCRLKCTCQLWYHHGCLLQAFRDPKQRGKCLQCRKSISVILAWETILRKYGLSSQDWKEAYHKLYTDFYKKGEYGNGIRLTKLFFGDIKTFREKLPNYILLPIFDLYDYMVYTQKEHNQIFYQEFNHILEKSPKNQDTLPQIVGIPSLYKTGEHTIITKKLFKHRFKEFSYNILDETFDWKNIFLAGGAVYRLISPVFSQFKHIPESSDLDLFIYGHTEDHRKKALHRTLKYLKRRFGDELFFVVHVNRGLIDVYIRGYARHLQIICNTSKTIVETLELFDLEHLQIGYFNNKVYATPSAIEAIKTQISQRSKPGSMMKYDRLKKGLGFHLSFIIRPEGDSESTDQKERDFFKKDLKDINESITQVKNIHGVKLLKPDNIEKFLEKTAGEYTEKLQEAVEEYKCYYPKYEEDDSEVISNLQKQSLTKGKPEIYYTKDPDFVEKKINFVERTKENFDILYGGLAGDDNEDSYDSYDSDDYDIPDLEMVN